MSQNRFKYRSSSALLSAALFTGVSGLLILSTSGSAHAGFEWVPPKSATPPAVRPAVPVEPVDSTMTPMREDSAQQIDVEITVEPAPAPKPAMQPPLAQIPQQQNIVQPAPARPQAPVPVIKATPSYSAPVPVTQQAEQLQQAPAPKKQVIRSINVTAKPTDNNAVADVKPASATLEEKELQNAPQENIETVIYWQQERQVPSDLTPAPEDMMHSREPEMPKPLATEDLTAPPKMDPVQAFDVEQPADNAPTLMVIVPDDAPVTEDIIDNINTNNAPIIPPKGKPSQKDSASQDMAADQPEAARNQDPALSAVKGAKKRGLQINPYPNLSKADAVQGVSGKYITQNTAPSISADDVLNADSSIIEGFGTDMPLALALQQIVPPSYAYSFGESVNPGAFASWNGGKPWYQVMEDMLMPLGLKGELRENKVVIRTQNASVLASDNMMIDNMPMQDDSLLKMPETTMSAQQTSPMKPKAKAGQVSIDPKPATPRRNIIADPGQASNASSSLMPSPNQVAAIPLKASASAMPKHEIMSFTADKGQKLKDVIDAWAKDANIDVIWNTSKNPTLDENVALKSTFEMAVKTALAEALPPNTSGLMVVFEKEKIGTVERYSKLIINEG